MQAILTKKMANASKDILGVSPFLFSSVRTLESKKADRTFVRGDATVDIDDFLNPNVDITLDNWHMINGQAAPGVQALIGDGYIASEMFQSGELQRHLAGKKIVT